MEVIGLLAWVIIITYLPFWLTKTRYREWLYSLRKLAVWVFVALFVTSLLFWSGTQELPIFMIGFVVSVGSAISILSLPKTMPEIVEKLNLKW